MMWIVLILALAAMSALTVIQTPREWLKHKLLRILNQFELFGMAGGVSFMLQNDEGKRFIKKMSDLSYMA